MSIFVPEPTRNSVYFKNSYFCVTFIYNYSSVLQANAINYDAAIDLERIIKSFVEN